MSCRSMASYMGRMSRMLSRVRQGVYEHCVRVMRPSQYGFSCKSNPQASSTPMCLGMNCLMTFKALFQEYFNFMDWLQL